MEEAFLGTILMWAGKHVPEGWEFCHGQDIPLPKNPQSDGLYCLIGTTYGGDGRTSYKLPDLRKAVPIANVDFIICRRGVFPRFD